jgi:DNA topoisomerase IA
MKSLVIAEKPSVGRDIAKVLKCSKNMNGALEGDRYIVTWGLGHLVALADPEAYDIKYKEWKMEHLPMLPQKFELVIMKQTSKQYQTVKTQIHRGDVSEIIIATDAGREGELVARWILEKANNKKPIKRLWISSVTDKAIREGFAHLKDGKEYEKLYQAAVARAESDWIVGMNATRALTCKYNASLGHAASLGHKVIGGLPRRTSVAAPTTQRDYPNVSVSARTTWRTTAVVGGERQGRGFSGAAGWRATAVFHAGLAWRTRVGWVTARMVVAG